MSQPTITDPFGQTSTPSLSFDQKPIGTSYTGTVKSEPGWAQSRDFKTGDPVFWPDGNPKMMATVEIQVPSLAGEKGADDDGSRTVFAPKPSSLFSAIAKAQREAGAGALKPGGLLTVTLIGEEPAKQQGMNAKKLYDAKYTPGAGVFAEQAAPAASPQPVSAPSGLDAVNQLLAQAAGTTYTAPVAAAPAPAVGQPAALSPEMIAALLAQQAAAQAPAAPAIDPAVKAQVLQLKAVNLPAEQIAAALGLTPEQVAAVQG